MRDFASQIYAAINAGGLSQPFNAAMVRKACPGWGERTYKSFLPKHAVGNGKNTELFVRVGRGLYRVSNPNLLQGGIRTLWGRVEWEGDLELMRLD